MIECELLVTDERKVFGAPSDEAMESILTALFAAKETWATLSLDPRFFVTATGSREAGFVLEYEESSPDFHQRIPGRVDMDAVLRIFRAFRQGGLEWVHDFQWEKVNLADIDFKKTPSLEPWHPKAA